MLPCLNTKLLVYNHYKVCELLSLLKFDPYHKVAGVVLSIHCYVVPIFLKVGVS